MKAKILYICFFLLPGFLCAQHSSEKVPISEIYSSNGTFKLKSISLDNEFHTLRGVSYVLSSDSVNDTLYSINRSFDLFFDRYFAAISNDGRKIIYIKQGTPSTGLEHNNITYYVDGRLATSYSIADFTGMQNNGPSNPSFQDSIGLSLQNQVNKGIKHNNFPRKRRIINIRDTIYVIDFRNKVTIYNLNNGEFIGRDIELETLYPKIKDLKPAQTKVYYYKFPSQYVNNLKDLTTNEGLGASLGHLLGLKYVPLDDPTFRKYHLNRIELKGYAGKDGKFEIEELKVDKGINKRKVTRYLLNARFDVDFIPKEVDKIYLSHFFGGYRDYNDKKALKKTVEEQKRLQTARKINGVYIPKNLYECIIALDKELDLNGKKLLSEEEPTWKFNGHMGGLGMWIRNNWKLHAKSRLQKYFIDRGVGNPIMPGEINDEISHIIIDQYRTWLKGDKMAWKKWEAENPIHKD